MVLACSAGADGGGSSVGAPSSADQLEGPGAQGPGGQGMSLSFARGQRAHEPGPGGQGGEAHHIVLPSAAAATALLSSFGELLG